MNVVIIAQCNKRALTETRRILDQFAERKGDRVWQTAITWQGLVTLRRMLRKSARRNTAVACHWIHRKNHSELLWVVGNMRRFNADGSVPTNSTASDILRRKDENNWHTAEAISLLAGIAGLFHDFGKANEMFQKKLKPRAKIYSEPYRHEWVSLRLFQAFVGKSTDVQWLERLRYVKLEDESEVLQSLVKDVPEKNINVFKSMPAVAQAVGWLILSHHRLPKHHGEGLQPDIGIIDQWLLHRNGVKPHWNSPQCLYDDWTQKQLTAVWEFPLGTPMHSELWRDKASSIAKRALNLPGFTSKEWLVDRFSIHMARLNLMLADHLYSAGEARTQWQDKSYKAIANTDRKTGKSKQKLDEHNVGVAHNALLLSKSMPLLRRTLPAITRHKAFKARSTREQFRWQDKAYELACSIRERSEKQGFFGVNMASTGCGKTFANARIMYGLASESEGCRFNVALGLRALTLQTGDALRERLKLDDDDLAVLIGSAAVQDLHQQGRKQSTAKTAPLGSGDKTENGSESSEALLESFHYVRYEGSLEDGRLGQWLKHSPKLHALLSAPVLVSTIDRLILATEGERGGKQIAPMLRLLTSDLVLDEPDDFGLEDVPALCRLVNWAGMLGSRVLLASATLPPALVQALFIAYSEGRRIFNASCGEPGMEQGVCCGWFDEYGSTQMDISNLEDFSKAHDGFVEKRIDKLKLAPAVQQAELLELKSTTVDVQEVVECMAQTVAHGIERLHGSHHAKHPSTGKRVSIGLVRMANINPMVSVLQELISKPPPPDTRIHFACYHSHHPLLVRSAMEMRLDNALTRHKPERLWDVPEIVAGLENGSEANHIFVVFATAVAEVGRDHDYDWAIAEPSSMRSLIQLAGRILRHRRTTPDSPNFLILSQNFRALRSVDIAYTRPGFESRCFPLNSHDLRELLRKEHYHHISAIPRIHESQPLRPNDNLVDLEHAHLRVKLFGKSNAEDYVHAALWWSQQATWTAELQRLMPFRRSQADEEFILNLEDDEQEAVWHQLHNSGELKPVEQSRFCRIELNSHPRCRPWMNLDPELLIDELAEQLNLSQLDTSRKFAGVRLRKADSSAIDRWLYNPSLGIWSALS